MIQIAVLMVPLGMTRLWRINPVCQGAGQCIDFRGEHCLEDGQIWGAAFPLRNSVYNTKARCYLNIVPQLQIPPLASAAFLIRLKQDLGKVYPAKI